MLKWAAIFLTLTLLTGIFGYGGFAVVSFGIARILCGLFAILFVLALGAHLVGRK